MTAIDYGHLIQWLRDILNEDATGTRKNGVLIEMMLT